MTTAQAAEARHLDDLVLAGQQGDEPAFTAIIERYRPELQVHCYRMLGSLEDAEDLVQETFLRAWRGRHSFQGRSSIRAWLYRIATNACLDAIERLKRVVPAQRADNHGGEASAFEVSWLQPYPDQLLEAIPSREQDPGAAIVNRETIELAYVTAMQHLPPKQRAVLILRDVLDWPAKDTAALLELSVASVNSALQRARATLRQRLPERRTEWEASANAASVERSILQQYIEATERSDVHTLVGLLREDARFSMPPEPDLIVGAQSIIDYWVAGGFGSPEFGEFRSVPTMANRQLAAMWYLKQPDDTAYRAISLDVLRIESGLITEVTTFRPEPERFGLPAVL